MPRTDLKDVSGLCKTLEEPGPFFISGFPNISAMTASMSSLAAGLNTQRRGLYYWIYYWYLPPTVLKIQVELYRILSLYIYKPPYSYPTEIDVMDLGS